LPGLPPAPELGRRACDDERSMTKTGADLAARLAAPGPRALVCAALSATVLVVADLRAPGADIRADGLWDAAIFRQAATDLGVAGRRVDEGSAIVLGGLWASAPASLDVEVATRKGRRAFRVFADEMLAARGDAIVEPSVASLSATTSRDGTLILRLIPSQRNDQIAIRVLGVAVRQHGPGSVPAMRLVQYAALGGLLGFLLRRRRPWLVIATGVGAPLAVGAAILGARVLTLTLLPFFVAALTLAAAWTLLLGTGWVERLMPSKAATWIVAVLALRVACVLHPDFHGWDTRFHVHNAQRFEEGMPVASRAPGVAAAWYPPAAYVLLSPALHLADGVRDEDVLTLLLAALLEGGSCVLVYALARAARASREAAGAAAIAAAVMPEGLLVLAKGILCNTLGSLVGLAAVLAAVRGASAITLAALLALALLSHSGAAITTLLLLGAYWTWGALSDRRDRWQLGRGAACAAVAAVVAWVAYYHEIPLELEDGGTPAVGSAFLQIRWYRVGKLAQDAVLKFGLLPVLLAARGLPDLRALPLLQRLIGAWAGLAVALALVAVVTPFPLRAEYFAVPAVAIVAGLGADRLGREGHSRTVQVVWTVTFALQAAIAVAYTAGRFDLIAVILESPKWPFPFRLW
jgi:hypothetical protein